MRDSSRGLLPKNKGSKDFVYQWNRSHMNHESNKSMTAFGSTVQTQTRWGGQRSKSMNEYAPNDSIIRGQAKPQVEFQKHSNRPDNLFVNEGKQFLSSMLLESYPIKSKDHSLTKLDKLTATTFNVSKRKILHKEVTASTIDLAPRERLYDPQVFSKKRSVKLVRDFSK